jgi:hypothetical protein
MLLNPQLHVDACPIALAGDRNVGMTEGAAGRVYPVLCAYFDYQIPCVACVKAHPASSDASFFFF